MLWFLFFLITIVFLESTVFGWIGSFFGLWPTVGGVFASAIVGITIIRKQGFVVVLKLRDKPKAAQFSGIEFMDSICICIAGVALIIPGFLTDLLGTLLLIGPLRHSVGASVLQRNKRGKPFDHRQSTDVPPTIEGEFREVNNSKPTK